MVFDEVHLRWLSNIADLACARLITETKSHLHQQSLAEALANWFSDDLNPPEDTKMSEGLRIRPRSMGKGLKTKASDLGRS